MRGCQFQLDRMPVYEPPTFTLKGSEVGVLLDKVRSKTFAHAPLLGHGILRVAMAVQLPGPEDDVAMGVGAGLAKGGGEGEGTIVSGGGGDVGTVEGVGVGTVGGRVGSGTGVGNPCITQARP
jgi:hypothetical protein